MKKKLLTGLATGLVLLSLAATANAVPFQNSINDWEGLTLDGHGYQSISASTLDWTQTVNFNSLAMHINHATLSLTHRGNQNIAGTEFWFATDSLSTPIGTLSNSSNGWVTDHFDIIGLLSALPANSITLHLRLNENTTLNDYIMLDSSIITGDYTPTPEPATMLLLGSGLAGLATARRKKKTLA